MKLIFPFLSSLLLYIFPNILQDQVLIVLNKSANSVMFIDPIAMKVTSSLPTGEGPHEIAISPDGKWAYVANYGHQKNGNSIDVFDVEKKALLKRIDLGALQRPHGLSTRQGKLYFTLEVNRAVGRYDELSGKVDWVVGTGESATHMLVTTPDNKRAYTTNILSGTVTCINIGAPPTPEHIRHIKIGNKPEGIGITPDGKQVWVGDNETGTISIIETVSNTVSSSFQVGKMPIRIQFTPDGKKALISDPPTDEVVVIDASTKNILHRIKIEGAPVGLVIGKDGKHAYVAQTKLNRVSKIDLSSYQVVSSVETGDNPDGIAIF